MTLFLFDEDAEESSSVGSGITPWFPRRPGEIQGRVQNPAGFAQPEGDHALILGADQAGWTGRFSVGDTFGVFQLNSYSPAKIFRFTAKVRGPSRMPALSFNTLSPPGYNNPTEDTLIVAVDEGPNQTITIPALATPTTVLAAITAAIAGARAYLTGTAMAIESLSTGRRSRVRIVGGTANAFLGFRELVWRFQVLVNGVVLASRDLAPGEIFDLSDMGANLSAHSDPAEIRFRLTLGEVAVG